LNTLDNNYDVIIVGAGAAGLVASAIASNNNKKVLLVEQLGQIGTKLKATGGGRCNLSNTLSNDKFIKSFGKNGKFIKDIIAQFNHEDLIEFFSLLGVSTHIPDGFRIFPTTHKSHTIIEAFETKIKKDNINLKLNCKLKDLIVQKDEVIGIVTSQGRYYSSKIILATGGLGYATLGATGETFDILARYNHTITPLYPAMMPLFTKERWVANCTADTIPKVTIKVNLPDNKKLKKIQAIGDLIFTKDGIRGPVVLDFAREITPFLDQFKEVPIIVKLTKITNENELILFIKKEITNDPNKNIGGILSKILPLSVVKSLCNSIDINPTQTYKQIDGIKKQKLHKIVINTPLHIIGHKGFANAMITRGGVSLKQIDPKTLQSKILKNLYFCGEMVDIDGPCGGYNLQWAFSSGYVCGNPCLY
jgi:predicted Rossmann fold flavoprotein